MSQLMVVLAQLVPLSLQPHHLALQLLLLRVSGDSTQLQQQKNQRSGISTKPEGFL